MIDKDWWPVKRRVANLSSQKAVEGDSDLIKRIRSNIQKLEKKIKEADALRGRSQVMDVIKACRQAVEGHRDAIELCHKQLVDLGVDMSGKGRRER